MNRLRNAKHLSLFARRKEKGVFAFSKEEKTPKGLPPFENLKESLTLPPLTALRRKGRAALRSRPVPSDDWDEGLDEDTGEKDYQPAFNF